MGKEQNGWRGKKGWEGVARKCDGRDCDERRGNDESGIEEREKVVKWAKMGKKRNDKKGGER